MNPYEIISILYSSAWLLAWVLVAVLLTRLFLKSNITNKQIILASLIVVLISQIITYFRLALQTALGIANSIILIETIGLILFFVTILFVSKLYWKFDNKESLKFALISALIFEAISWLLYSLNFL